MNGALKNFIIDLDRKHFLRYVAGFFILFGIIIGLLVFFQRRKVNALEKKLRSINQQRDTVRKLLRQHAEVNQQREAVDAILAKDKNFKITQYFDQIVKELGLSQHLTTPTPPFSETDLQNGYIETQLDSSFKGMDIKQVSDLLYKIEQNDRVYTKELVLLRPPSDKKLSVTLIIATLQPQSPI